MKTGLFYRNVKITRRIFGTDTLFKCEVNGKNLNSFNDIEPLYRKIDRVLDESKG